MTRNYLVLITGLLLLCTPATGLAFGGGGNPPAQEKSAPALPQDYMVQVRIPVFSDLFTNIPVAAVDRQPILLGELIPDLKVVDDEMPLPVGAAALTQRFNQVLEKLISERSTDGGKENVKIFAQREIHPDRTLVLGIPIFSPAFAFAPVASVNEEPIPMGEFARELGEMHAEKEDSAPGPQNPDNPANMLDRLVVVRLVEQEARNMGIDQQGQVIRQVEDFAEKTLLYQLLDQQVQKIELDREEVQKVYQDISLAAKLEDYRILKEEDAEALRTALAEGGQFDELISKAVEEGKAVPGEGDDYIMFKELLSTIASTAKEMKVGEVSPIFRVGKDFAVFKLLDRKFVEDPEALKVAEKIVWDQQVAEKSKEYFQAVIDKYSTFEPQAKEDLNMTLIKEENPEIMLSEVLDKFREDDRVLVSVDADGKTQTLKVNEVTARLEKMYFHGTDIALKAQEADERIGQIIDDWVFRLGGAVEARNLGIDKSMKYILDVEDFERRTLFDHFMQKVVMPDVKLTEEEVRAYYDENRGDYSTPAMLKLESLAFDDKEQALAALDKLHRGSDFNWVSANVQALIPSDDLPLLDFGKGILSMTSLPEDLQKSAQGIETGESIFYSDAEGYHYVIYFQKVYPPEPKPYDQVRSQILDIVYQNRVKETLMNYVEKLKEHYPTEIYLALHEG